MQLTPGQQAVANNNLLTILFQNWNIQTLQSPLSLRSVWISNYSNRPILYIAEVLEEIADRDLAFKIQFFHWQVSNITGAVSRMPVYWFKK